MLGRVIAVVLLLVGIVGIGIAIAGVLFGFQVVDALSESLDETLALTSESLDTVNDTLLLTQQTVAQTGQAIGTVADTTDSVAQTLADTQPLLDEVSRVALSWPVVHVAGAVVRARRNTPAAPLGIAGAGARSNRERI